jgi:hypothetical protein
MNKKEKERIALMLIKIAKEVREYLLSEEGQDHPFYRSESFLVSSFDEEREEILENLLDDPVYAAKFSEEYLEKLLKEQVRAMIRKLQEEVVSVRPKKIARDTAEAIFNELDNYTTQVTVYLPVAGITLQTEEGRFEMGNITLQVMTPQRIDELRSHITLAIMANLNTPDEKQALLQYFERDLQRVFREKERPVYALYHVVAEPIQAETRAKEACYQVFDILRYALPFLTRRYPMEYSIPKKLLDNDTVEVSKYTRRDRKVSLETDKHMFFGLEGETGTMTDIISSIFILRDSPGFNWNNSRKGPFLPLRIDAHVLQGLEMAKVFEASQILTKEEASRTNFERCILRSMHWFANAQTPMQPEYVFTSLMSSIEAFLNPPGVHEKVTIAIVEGVAALGGEQGFSYTKKRMDSLYTKRSALSHGDRAEIMERDISELRAVAFYLIHQMLQRRDEFTTQEQLYEEVKKIREEIKESSAKASSTDSPQHEMN